MQVSVENTGDIARKMTVVIPSKRLETVSEDRLQQVAKTVKIDGFRPGKVPFNVVRSRYAESVYFEVVQQVIDETLREALQQEKIVPAALPEVTPTTMESGKDLEYVADFDVYPEFKKLDLTGVKIKKATAKVAKKDIDETIDTIRKQHIDWKEVSRKSKEGDRVLVDFNGTIDGAEFSGGKAEQFPVVLGEGQMLPEFDKGLRGVKADESPTVKVQFPKDYPGEEVAGKTAEFAITVHSVSESVLPEVDEEFIKKFQAESVEKFRTDVEKNLETNVESTLSNLNRSRVLNAVIEENKVSVPRKMIEEETDRMITIQKDQMKQKGMNPDQFNPNRDELKPEAERRVALGLMMMDIVNKEGIKVDETKVKEYVERMAASYQDPQQLIDYYYSDQQAIKQVESVVLENQVVDHLLATAIVSDEKVVVSELLKGEVA